ncbi:hypothetical protein H4696_008463 [Amycolatopsis lexingtonensis]|uniref:Uncharacterized protein n=1 Tax=Amycolatopsis lexingtonensis TaxID=218822 RepID=A0ABR9IDV3_9PSEU|nr:hypothetical protein [Amycolatopsis lexingtonensis]MBE1501363.1 hypothetical protein [Amycolatopsis lexingtonensis]
MPEGFRIASAYVSVHLEDNTEADERRIRQRLERGNGIHIKTVLDDPDGIEKVKERVRRSSPAKLPVEADNPIDDAWRSKIRASIKRTAADSLKIPVDPETEGFRRNLNAVLQEVEKGLKAEIPADLDKAAEFKAEVQMLAHLASEEVKVRIPVEIDGDTADSEAEKVARRINGRFNALAFAGLSAGLPAAAAVGAAATVAALSIVPAAFAAIGAAALKNDDAVSDSFKSLKSSVVADTQSMATVLRGPLLEASADLKAAFNRLRPEIQQAFTGSGPAVEELTGSVTDLAENAMPGMVTAISKSQGALEGFRSFTGQVGAGVSDMLINMSRGADDAGRSMTIFGNISRDLLGFVGALAAQLATAQGPLTNLQAGLQQAESAVLKLTSTGGAATSFLTGFGSAATGALTLVNALASAINVLPADVVKLGGAFAASAMILNKFGVDAGAGFKGLGEKIKAADGAGGKFKTTMSGLAGGVFNPATAATAGLGVALALMGQDAERAAHASATLAASQQTFTQALRESKGAIDDNVRASVAQDLAQKTINGNSKSLLDFAKQFGVALPQVTSAVLGESGALEGVNQQLDAYAKANPDAATTVAALKAAIASKGIAFRDSTDAVSAEASATDQSTAAQNRSRDAVNKLTQAIYEQQNAQLGYRGAVLNSKQAVDDFGKVSKDAKATEDDKAQALLRVEQAFASQEQAAYQAAYANSTSKDAAVRTSEALAAQRQETVNLANAFQGVLPQSLQQTIGKMSATEAQAAGLKLKVNNLGTAVYELPNGKQIVITSNADQQAAAMANLRDKINQIPTNKKSTVEIVTIYKTVGTAAVRTGANSPDVYLYGPHSAGGGLPSQGKMKRFASGGPTVVDASAGGLLKGPGTGTSDDILTLFSNGMIGKTSDEEFVVNAEQTAKWYPLLVAINKGLRGFADGGLVRAEDGTMVPPSFYDKAPSGPHAIYSAQGFAKLKARAAANGFGSLSAFDQAQLRTYGGYAVASSTSAVTAVAPTLFRKFKGELPLNVNSVTPVGSGTTSQTREPTVVNIYQSIYTMDPTAAAHKAASDIAWQLRNR